MSFKRVILSERIIIPRIFILISIRIALYEIKIIFLFSVFFIIIFFAIILIFIISKIKLFFRNFYYFIFRWIFFIFTRIIMSLHILFILKKMFLIKFIDNNILLFLFYHHIIDCGFYKFFHPRMYGHYWMDKCTDHKGF